jgi:hypothetical protein
MGGFQTFHIASTRRFDENIIGNYRHLLRPQRRPNNRRQKRQAEKRPA